MKTTIAFLFAVSISLLIGFPAQAGSPKAM